MSAKTIQLHLPPMTTRNWLQDGAFLSLFLFIGFFALSLNYWLGLGVLAVASLAFIGFSAVASLARGFLAVAWVYLFTAIGVGSVAQSWFLSNPPGPLFSRFDSAYLIPSAFLGLVSATVVVAVLILTTFWLAARVLLDWHEHHNLSLGQVLQHMVNTTLSLHRPTLVVVNKQLEGSEEDILFMKTIGGPGWLQIYPGHYVVLYRWGKITRIVQAGSVMLKTQEKVKAILPTGGDGTSKTIYKVSTRDKITLNVKLSYAAKIMTAAEIDGSSEEKLKQFSGGERLGDHYLAVLKQAPKPAEAISGDVESHLRDVFMAMNFEDLFALSDEELRRLQRETQTNTPAENPTPNPEPWLEALCDSRPIRKIERHILEKVKQAKIGNALAVLNIDITELEFPEDIAEKAAEEIKAQIESRIRVNVARAKLTEARAIAHIRTLHGQGEGEAKAAQYRELVNALRRDGGQVNEDMLKALLAQPSNN